MTFGDLIRVTVLLTGAEATALAMIAVVAAQRQDDSLTLIVGGAWWLVAVIVGLLAGRSRRAAEGVAPALAKARMATSLPAETPTRLVIQRLWPIALSAVVAGGLGIVFPGVAAIGAGFALMMALAWRGREAAVEAIEQRDGARFYVLPGSALKPIELMRTPGLLRDRDASPKHPPPPPHIADEKRA